MKFVSSNRDQVFLMPPDMRDWVPQDSIAHFVLEAVERVPLSSFTVNRRGTGSAQYHPRMMLAVLVYCYSTGVFSSRRIERATHMDVAVRYLAANEQPDHDTIAKFRRENLEAVKRAFVEVLEVARELRLVQVGTVSVDGTKIDANASKHRSLTYARAGELSEQLELEVNALMEQAEQADSEDDGGSQLPEELADREKLKRQVDEARRRLEARKRAEAKAARAKAKGLVEEPAGDKPPACAPPTPPPEPLVLTSPGAGAEVSGPAADAGETGPDPADEAQASVLPKPTDQTNLTDPDSRVMRQSRQHAFRQAYNAQAAVDTGSHLIVGACVTQSANDRTELGNTVSAIPENLGKPGTVLADNGYASESEVKALNERGIDALVSTGAEGRRRRHDFRPQKPPRPEPKTRSKFVQEMTERLKSETGRALYALRKQTVEPVFGTVKAAMGFRHFHLRGLEKVSGEWKLVALAYNIRRVHNLIRQSAAA